MSLIQNSDMSDGRCGYGSLQEFMILGRYLDEISPDIVLWQFCSNDFINNYHELESVSFSNNNQMTRPYYKNSDIEWLFPKKVWRMAWQDGAIFISAATAQCPDKHSGCRKNGQYRTGIVTRPSFIQGIGEHNLRHHGVGEGKDWWYAESILHHWVLGVFEV